MIEITLRKKHIIFMIVCLVLASSYSVVLSALAAFSCTVSTTCSSGVVMMRMSSTTNAHAELASQSLYPDLVCCTGPTGLGNSCSSGTYADFLDLSSTTNAHVEQNDQGNYTEKACIQVPTGGTVTVGYQDNNCSGYDTTVLSIASSTDSHVGTSTAYTRKVCASVTQPTLTFIVDSSSQDLNVTPGALAATTSKLYAKTNNPSGFNVSTQKNSATTLALVGDPSVVIPDKTEWVAPGATTTSSVATASSSDPYSLQFRLRAQDTDTANFSSAWWGADDTSSGALFAGFPSSNQYIIDRSTAAPATTTATVLYNLAVDTNQVNGTYTGTITYSATVNP